MSQKQIPPVLSIIVVTWNTRDTTLACLRSLYACNDESAFEIVVVDNASSDATAAAIAREFEDVTLIRNETNRGFAAANNQGIRASQGEFILLLNSDTVMHSGTLRDSIKYLDDHPRIGILGVRAVLESGIQQSTVFRDKGLLELCVNVFVPNRVMRRMPLVRRFRYVGLNLDRPQLVDVVAGCFMLTRREMINEIGVMDESFFMYGEEAEWCHRARQGGWSVAYFPGGSITHYGGVSAAQAPQAMSVAFARSYLLLLQRTRGPFIAYIANLLMLLRDLPRTGVRALVRHFPHHRLQSYGESLEASRARLSLHLKGVIKPDWSR